MPIPGPATPPFFAKRRLKALYVQLPVFTHEVTDVGSFRLFTTQLIVNGTASPAEIVAAFGVPTTTVKRCIKAYRDKGAKVFFAPPKKRQGHKLTPERLQEVQALLDRGESIPAISAEVGVLQTTLHKAIGCGRLQRGEKKQHRALEQTL